ncbi:conserved hypothetical protein [Rubrivivax sp. A210]|uniref:hypothetical protein n=1 Tax=Rubrivivax sp. A210 TaxID=2772301 RepID=UPI00191A4413|nr:hypothetical protein [Rubrivivax sp. A210]CAD5374420.1 conserved hypothetical protein [Rubrivivax sp. A210]
MISTLIDNATVSSVQRALGKAQIRDLSVLDVEHAALERLVEAVLLSDRVVVPDNYKQQFTPARKKLLEQLGVEFIEVDEKVDGALSLMARNLTEPWLEAFNAGKDRDLFKDYFGQINAFSNFIWEHSSSELFLVFRAHGIDKESPLISALLSSPIDVELGKRLEIVAEDGGAVAWNRLSRHVQHMLSVMGWMGHQYIWYQCFAASHDFVYSPHPLREFFANDFLSRTRSSAASAAVFSNLFRKGTDTFRGQLKKNLQELGALNSSIVAHIPPLLPVVAAESSTADDFLSVLGQLREQPRVAELRAALSEAHDRALIGDLRARNALLLDFSRIGAAVLAERGIDQRFISLKPPTAISGIKLEGDDAGVRLPIPSILYRQYFLHRTFRAFLRDILSDLAAPSQYGALKTKLNSWVWPPDSGDVAPSAFYLNQNRVPSLYYRPLTRHNERFTR